MDEKPELDLDYELWFYHKGCEGKHYLIGNPHTFPGRMFAWCPKMNRSFYVSKSEMEAVSEASKYWIKGFLYGNQPSPPADDSGDVDFDSPAYEQWAESVEHFTQTGFWSDMARTCEACQKPLRPSQPGPLCLKCQA